jgi:acetyl esterase
MAVLDDDAAQVIAMIAASGRADITQMSPREVRDYYDQFPVMPGAPVHEVRDFSVPGPRGDIPVRLYRPSAATGMPVLVWYHGGGMVIGSLKQADWISRQICADAGMVVVSVDYRLAPEHKFPAAVEDAFAAVAWVCARAAEIGGDAARVSVGGDSAGGTCAAVASLLARDRGGVAILSQLLVYPGTDRDLTRPSVTEFAEGPVLTKAAMLWFRGHYHSDLAELTDPRANPALAATHHGLPRAFVINAEIDPIRDAGENYGNLLAHAGVLTLLKRYNGVFHGFFTMGPMMAKTREAVADAVRFLRQVNGG